ncbi:uncharacterized protein LOC143174601 [Nomia melanderi]|uniref:uncharacterized protein LOC143174601 n=1 Tax=Nomia melanderi TaxID=2448451 RepID=UPI003FCEA0CE
MRTEKEEFLMNLRKHLVKKKPNSLSPVSQSSDIIYLGAIQRGGLLTEFSVTVSYQKGISLYSFIRSGLSVRTKSSSEVQRKAKTSSMQTYDLLSALQLPVVSYRRSFTPITFVTPTNVKENSRK